MLTIAGTFVDDDGPEGPDPDAAMTKNTTNVDQRRDVFALLRRRADAEREPSAYYIHPVGTLPIASAADCTSTVGSELLARAWHAHAGGSQRCSNDLEGHGHAHAASTAHDNAAAVPVVARRCNGDVDSQLHFCPLLPLLLLPPPPLPLPSPPPPTQRCSLDDRSRHG